MTKKVTPILDERKWTLERRCKMAGTIYDVFFNGLRLTTIKKEGVKIQSRVHSSILTMHQRKFFLQGLKKLGLDPAKESHAVICGKYHYLSNLIGGLKMEYIEESPKKVWIRYGRWYSGLDRLSIPFESEKAVFAWHRLNGKSLGNPRLGFVLVKLPSVGDPYVEGYFQEFDRELFPEERLQYKPGEIGPDFDPSKAPKLDPEEWPPIRLWKARRNFSRDYAGDSIRALLKEIGKEKTSQIVRETWKQVGVHFTEQWFQELELKEKSARGIAVFLKFIGDILGDPTELEEIGPRKFIIRQKSCIMFPEPNMPKEIFEAMAVFNDAAAKVLNQRVRVLYTKNIIDDGVSEWTVEEFGRRVI